VKLNAKMLDHYLIERGIDQRRLASLAGVSEPTITRMKRGEDYAASTLGKLARALECNPIDLVDVAEYVPPHMGAPSFIADAIRA
jgi:DNA-binding Xre family transcriptional regulator